MRNPISKLNYLQNNLNRDHKSKKNPSLREKDRPKDRRQKLVLYNI